MIKIGETKLHTSVPDDLDQRLADSTGLNTAQTRAVLSGRCSAQEVAAALEPLLVEPVHRVDLARMIAAEGPETVGPDVLKLYEPTAQASSSTKEDKSGKASK